MSESPEIIKCSISPEDFLSMRSGAPIEVQVRLFLNSKGFKFVDDKKPSLIINKNPIALGKITRHDDAKSGLVFYRQEIL